MSMTPTPSSQPILTPTPGRGPSWVRPGWAGWLGVWPLPTAGLAEQLIGEFFWELVNMLIVLELEEM